MAYWPASLLLGLLALCHLPTGDAQCGFRNFTCGDGKCIDANLKCNGSPDCSDESDEFALMCDKAPSVRMRVGDVVTVRLHYKEEHGNVDVQLCDDSSCSSLLLRGSTVDGVLNYKGYTGCNARGDYCPLHSEVHPDGWEKFRDGPITFTAERRSSEIAFWLQGHEDKGFTMPVPAASDLLRVRPFYWSTDMPVEFHPGWKTSLVPDNETASPNCANGGTSPGGACICQPGFGGLHCDQACGPDKFGYDCERSCSSELTGAGKGCRGVRFSAGYSTSCAAGLQGPRCDQVCDKGQYGAGCSEACGKCGGGGHCDPYSGECYEGCLPGYHGASCKQDLTYMVVAPNITKVTSHSVEGSVVLEGNTAGSGAVKYVQVQHRELRGGEWAAGALVELKKQSDTVFFTLNGLRVDTEVELQAVLLDERMRGRQSAPPARVQTSKGVLSNIAATNDEQGNARVSWQLSEWSLPVIVEYQCESGLGCPDRCDRSSGRVQVAANDKDAVLTGLLPAARYLITVRAGQQADTAILHTLLRAPNITVTSAEAVWVTNSSALVQWGPPTSCLEIGAPMQGYQWQLIHDSSGAIEQSGNTTAPVLSFKNLQPGTKYRVQVAVANTVGVGGWTSIHFTTPHKAPSAPRDLSAYRWNATTLSLVWRPPALPGGEVQNYSVVVDGVPEGPVSPHSRCSAWPDMVCHVARRPRTGRRLSNLTVVVAARNDVTEVLGDEASITVTPRDGKPDPVTGLEAVPSIDAVTVRWHLPSRLRGDPRSFVVAVNRVLLGSSEEELSPDPDVLSVPAKQELPVYEDVVQGLQPNATYKATVRCFGSGGISDEASVQFTTASDLKRNPSEDEVHVEWFDEI